MNIQDILKKIEADLIENRKEQKARKAAGRTCHSLINMENRLSDLHFILSKNEVYLNAILGDMK